MRHLVALLAIVVGCDAPPSDVEPPCGITIHRSSLTVWPPFEQLDLVVVADGSGLSPSARDTVVARLVRDLRVLATGDTDGDGVPDFDAYRSLHVAVVSADVGDD